LWTADDSVEDGDDVETEATFTAAVVAWTGGPDPFFSAVATALCLTDRRKVGGSITSLSAAGDLPLLSVVGWFVLVRPIMPWIRFFVNDDGNKNKRNICEHWRCKYQDLRKDRMEE
jgi:hypothetical protein